MLLQQPLLLAGIDFQRLWRVRSRSAPMSGWMVAGWAERGLQIVNYFGSNYGAALAFYGPANPAKIVLAGVASRLRRPKSTGS